MNTIRLLGCLICHKILHTLASAADTKDFGLAMPPHETSTDTPAWDGLRHNGWTEGKHTVDENVDQEEIIQVVSRLFHVTVLLHKFMLLQN